MVWIADITSEKHPFGVASWTVPEASGNFCSLAHYIAATTERTGRRCVGKGADQRCKVAIQTNNVDVDDRGYVYIVDRADTGLHILQLTGDARKVANF